jgi:TolB protein
VPARPHPNSYKIGLVQRDGSVRVLNRSLRAQVDPAWSPSGSQIAFSGGTEPNTEPHDIYVMNADGSGLRQITSSPTLDLSPAWSPDGEMITFARNLNGHDNIFIVDARTLETSQLSRNTTGQDSDPAWSPDGTKIAFSRNADGIPRIVVMDADGSNVATLTDPGRGADSSPDWSPDGTKIAFTRTLNQNSYGGAHDIYVVNVDGTGLTQFTTKRGDDAAPSWSPDGTEIAFTSNRAHEYPDPRHMDLYVMNSNGTNETRITFDANLGYSPTGFGGPDWRP